jgi:hypothetical protein
MDERRQLRLTEATFIALRLSRTLTRRGCVSSAGSSMALSLCGSTGLVGFEAGSRQLDVHGSETRLTGDACASRAYWSVTQAQQHEKPHVNPALSSRECVPTMVLSLMRQ